MEWNKSSQCRSCVCTPAFSKNESQGGGRIGRPSFTYRIERRRNGYLNFEEDCDASVALRELMDSGIIAPRTDNYFRPGEYEACIDRSLQRWNPAYWRARQKRLSVQAAKATKERER